MWDEEKLIIFFLRKKKSINITSSHTDILKFHVMNFITISPRHVSHYKKRLTISLVYLFELDPGVINSRIGELLRS